VVVRERIGLGIAGYEVVGMFLGIAIIRTNRR
jgi:hypothetical protein